MCHTPQANNCLYNNAHCSKRDEENHHIYTCICVCARVRMYVCTYNAHCSPFVLGA